LTTKIMRETDITKIILRELRSMGVFCWKHWQGGFAKKGIADILGCLPRGRFLAIEVKTENGKLTEYQHRFIDDINRAGGLAFVARTVEDVIQELSKAQVEPPQGKLFDAHRF